MEIANQESENSNLLVAESRKVIDTYGDIYPELREHRSHIERILTDESKRYNRSIRVGEDELKKSIKECKEYHTQSQAMMLLKIEEVTGHVYIPEGDKGFITSYLEKKREWRSKEVRCVCELCKDVEAYTLFVIETLQNLTNGEKNE